MNNGRGLRSRRGGCDQGEGISMNGRWLRCRDGVRGIPYIAGDVGERVAMKKGKDGDQAKGLQCREEEGNAIKRRGLR